MAKVLETVYEKIAGTGQKIEVLVLAGSSSAPELRCRMDGKAIMGTSLNKIPAHLLKPRADGKKVTHEMGGKIGFTEEEAATIQAAFDRAVEAWEATPARRLERLINERDILCLTYTGLTEQEQVRRERAWDEEGDVEGAFRTPPEKEDRIAAARKAINDFDTAHPEVITEINRRRQERLREFEAAD